MNKKKNPSNNASITLWEIHIPPPFSVLQDTLEGPTHHDIWVNSFKHSTFQSLKSAKGSVAFSNCHCFTCKAINHTFPLCPIHEHHAWCLQHPEYKEDASDQDDPAEPPCPCPTHGN